jgi:hypothetical protein
VCRHVRDWVRSACAAIKVAVNEGRYREDVDFFVRAAQLDWSFQLAEVQLPGRRRGQEHRDIAKDPNYLTPYQPGRDSQEGPDWLAKAVDRKLAKRYASAESLHLLLYANFDADHSDYNEMARRLESYSTQFCSLWVMTNIQLCSIFSDTTLGALNNWGSIRTIESYWSCEPST